MKLNMLLKVIFFLLLPSTLFLCKKKEEANPLPVPVQPKDFIFKNASVNNVSNTTGMYKIPDTAVAVVLNFNVPVSKVSISSGVLWNGNGGVPVSFSNRLGAGDSSIIIYPQTPLKFLTKYVISISTTLASAENVHLKSAQTITITTGIDSADKFPRVADEALLDLIQKQTFKYFWDFGHPVSGMARERNATPDVVTTGGTGFGVMSILVGINRNFISRAAGLDRVNKIVNFLKNNCTRYHGTFAHWINGATGVTIPFSARDDGGDLVETSLLMQGLLCARQYFNNSDAIETSLRDNINILYDEIDWNWFRNGNQNVLYWHWSPAFNFGMNLPIKGWNESLIVYALAASSNKEPIPKIVYDNGWASSATMKNGNTYYGIQLPLGPALGGPLFFAHYSFLGINPKDLTDAYANYFTQNTNHSLINYKYCEANPKNYFGYSNNSWGLTASDDNISGYSAHSPTNDDGVISPTAAISSLPYTPQQSMTALKFFYYTLGDKLFKQYGFIDAFNLSDLWFADSFLAIDQGPQIVMIENYRSGLLWNLFMSCPEIKRGLKNLGFQSPHL
ncbi:MAG: glucoamylase family protein [Ginsengibacter sp.]